MKSSIATITEQVVFGNTVYRITTNQHFLYCVPTTSNSGAITPEEFPYNLEKITEKLPNQKAIITIPKEELTIACKALLRLNKRALVRIKYSALGKVSCILANHGVFKGSTINIAVDKLPSYEFTEVAPFSAKDLITLLSYFEHTKEVVMYGNSRMQILERVQDFSHHADIAFPSPRPIGFIATGVM